MRFQNFEVIATDTMLQMYKTPLFKSAPKLERTEELFILAKKRDYK